MQTRITVDPTCTGLAARALHDRADSYSRDATQLRSQGDGSSAVLYETLRDELRAVAATLTNGQPCSQCSEDQS